MLIVEHAETSELKYNIKTLWKHPRMWLVVNEVGVNIGDQGSNPNINKIN